MNFKVMLITQIAILRHAQMQSFVSQVSTTEVGISGCGYFTLTKGFLVTLIGALITYQIIIYQLQTSQPK